MGKKTGRPRGRPKGSRNKSSAPIREAIREKDPIGRLFTLAEEARGRGDHEFEYKCLNTILPYGYPRLQATKVDMDVAGGGPLKVVFTPASE